MISLKLRDWKEGEAARDMVLNDEEHKKLEWEVLQCLVRDHVPKDTIVVDLSISLKFSVVTKGPSDGVEGGK